MDDARLTALETNIAFQEQTIHELSDVIHEQRQELDALKAEVRKIAERMTEEEGQPFSADGMPPVELPPHY